MWALDKLPAVEFKIYLAIVKETLGCAVYTSDLLSYQTISEITGINLRTVARHITKLIANKYIVRVSTNYKANIGKLPYMYRLNFKINGFPNLAVIENKNYNESGTN